MGNSKAAGALIFMALFWNGIVGIFDAVIVTQYAKTSVAAASYAPVQARITRSDVSYGNSGDGVTYSADIGYEYEFEGVQYLGERYSFMVMSSSERRFAERITKKYPVGQTVTAYVDPDEPSAATLEINAESFPAAILLFLMPFNCIGLLLIVSAVSALLKRRSRHEEDEVRARYLRVDTEDHVVFGPQRMSTFSMFIASTCGLSFFATFAVIFPFGFDAPMKVVFPVMVACMAVGAFIAQRYAKKGKSPEKFLHVDHRRGTFSYPANAPGVPLESIQSILAESEATNLSINDVRQYKHSFEAETHEGALKLFEVRTGMDAADEVLNLLRSELLRG